MPDVLTTCQLSSKLIDVPPPTKKMEAILFPFYHLFFLSVRHSRWRTDFWSDDDKSCVATKLSADFPTICYL